MREARRYSDFQIYRRLFQQARPLTPMLGALFLLQILATPLALLTPLPLKIAVDHVIGDLPLPSFLAWITPDSFAASKEAMLVFTAGLVIAITLLLLVAALAFGITGPLQTLFTRGVLRAP